MKQIKRSDERPLLKLFLFGAPGSGKTPLVASFNNDPRTAPLLLLNFAGRPETCLFYDETLHVLQIEKMSDINDVYAFFAQGQPPSHILRQAFDPPLDPELKFKTIGVDTYSTYQQWEAGKIVSGIDNIGEIKDLTKVPAPSDIRHWQQIAPNTIVPAQVFCDLPYHIIFTAQEYTQLDMAAGTSKRKPQLLGQAGELVPAFFNMTAVLVWDIPPKTIDPKQRPTVMMTWRMASKNGDAKQDWIRGDDVVDGMWNPTATKLFDLADKYHEEARNGN